MLTTGLTDGTTTVTAPSTDSGGSTDSGLSDGYEYDEESHDDALAQGDLINDVRHNITGNDMEYEADAGGDDTNVEVTDQNGGATNGGTTVIDPDTSDDSTGDRVGITEGTNDSGQETTTVVDEQGNSTTVNHATPSEESSSTETGVNNEVSASEPSVGAGTAAAALLVGAALVRGN